MTKKDIVNFNFRYSIYCNSIKYVKKYRIFFVFPLSFGGSAVKMTKKMCGDAAAHLFLNQYQEKSARLIYSRACFIRFRDSVNNSRGQAAVKRIKPSPAVSPKLVPTPRDTPAARNFSSSSLQVRPVFRQSSQAK